MSKIWLYPKRGEPYRNCAKVARRVAYGFTAILANVVRNGLALGRERAEAIREWIRQGIAGRGMAQWGAGNAGRWPGGNRG
jgi:hypothetical protein